MGVLLAFACAELARWLYPSAPSLRVGPGASVRPPTVRSRPGSRRRGPGFGDEAGRARTKRCISGGKLASSQCARRYEQNDRFFRIHHLGGAGRRRDRRGARRDLFLIAVGADPGGSHRRLSRLQERADRAAVSRAISGAKALTLACGKKRFRPSVASGFSYTRARNLPTRPCVGFPG